MPSAVADTVHPVSCWQRTRCPRLLDRLVRENLGLVYLWVKRSRPRSHAEADDLVQAGTLGLLRAFEMFDPERGAAFSTYASYHVRARLIAERYRNRRLVRPANIDTFRRVAPEGDPLARDASLDSPVGGGDATLGDLIPADAPEADPILQRRVQAALESLPERERRAAVGVLIEERLLREVADEIGTTPEGARQVLGRAVKRLRRALASAA